MREGGCGGEGVAREGGEAQRWRAVEEDEAGRAPVVLCCPCCSCRRSLHPRATLSSSSAARTAPVGAASILLTPHCREEMRGIGEKWVKKKGREVEEEGLFEADIRVPPS